MSPEPSPPLSPTGRQGMGWRKAEPEKEEKVPCSRLSRIERIDKEVHHQTLCHWIITPVRLCIKAPTPRQVGQVRDHLKHSPNSCQGQSLRASVPLTVRHAAREPCAPTGNQRAVWIAGHGIRIHHDRDMSLGPPHNCPHPGNRQSRKVLYRSVLNKVVPGLTP